MSQQKTLITSTDPKGIRATSLFQAKYNKAGLDDDGAQRLNESSEFWSEVEVSMAKHSRSDLFASEEVRSSYGYPQEYRRRSVAEQVEMLLKLFPGLTADYTKLDRLAARPLPEGMEWFAIPRWEKVAATYNQAVEKVLALIASKRKFFNYREGKLGEKYLRQLEKSIAAWKKIGEEQDGDILIVAAQFGIRHRGRSVRRARIVMIRGEFGLGAFAVGCMLLTHPEREVQWEQLHIDCAGDEYSPDGDGRFVYAPYFHFRDGRLKFDTHRIDDARGNYGSASGVAPQ